MELSARTRASRAVTDPGDLAEPSAQPGDEERRPGGGRRTAITVGAWIVVAVLIFLAAVREGRQEAVQSDGASIALQAWQMLHGNLLLKGWHVTDVSFYTTEMPVYMVVEAIRGLRIDVVAISEAINYTLTLVCGALVAKGRATGREGMTRALLAAGIMAAPTLSAANWLLNDADHAATALWVLLALLVLDRAPRRWYVPVIVGILLAWAVVGDPLIEVIGSAPLLIVGVVRAWPGDAFRRTVTWSEWLRGRWFELSLAAAGLLSAAVGAEATKAIGRAGGWVLVTAPHQFVQATTLPSNLAIEVQDFLVLFSANFFGHNAGTDLIPIVIHLVGAAVVVAGIWVAARRYRHGRPATDDLIADVLIAGIVCNLAAYLLLYSAQTSQIREVAPVFAFGAALAGRLLGPWLARNRLEPVLAVGIVCYLLTMGPAITGPAFRPANQSLTGWLESHHLTNGLAGYWQTNSVTFDSGGQITMRPVNGGKDGRPVVKLWETDTAQLNPATNSANFLVLTTGHLAPSPPVTEKGAEAKFGKPSHVYHYDGYTILVWKKNILVPLAS
ncbi:MAG TPA: hypothetical protein VK817_07350 [Trebonia sp.]|jgi:hypothetical protein|nr:hypothetical protein [Trebonia sp.]